MTDIALPPDNLTAAVTMFAPVGNGLYRPMLMRANLAGELLVTQAGAPVVHITPTVAGTPKPELELDAGASGIMLGYRLTANPGSAVEAATRLTNKYPDVMLCNLQQSTMLPFAEPVTDLYLVGIGNANNGNVVQRNNPTYAQLLAAQVRFEFSSTDAVNRIEILATRSWSSDRYVLLKITGYAQ